MKILDEPQASFLNSQSINKLCLAGQITLLYPVLEDEEMLH